MLCIVAIFFIFISITALLKTILFFLFDIQRSLWSQCLPACLLIASSLSRDHPLSSCRPQASPFCTWRLPQTWRWEKLTGLSIALSYLAHSHFWFNFYHLFSSLLSKKGDCIDTGHLCTLKCKNKRCSSPVTENSPRELCFRYHSQIYLWSRMHLEFLLLHRSSLQLCLNTVQLHF